MVYPIKKTVFNMILGMSLIIFLTIGGSVKASEVTETEYQNAITTYEKIQKKWKNNDCETKPHKKICQQLIKDAKAPKKVIYEFKDGALPYWGEVPIEDKDKAYNLSDDKVVDSINTVTNKESQGVDGKGIKTVKDKVENFVGIISALIFGLAVVMVAFAGFTYVTSEGDERKTRQAKTQILAAGIGVGISIFNLVFIKLFESIINVFN